MTTFARPSMTKKMSDQTKTIDPLEKRLNSIRIHLLDNKKPPKIIPLEPTLVFERFLYLGGLKSLHDQVNRSLPSQLFPNFGLFFSPKKKQDSSRSTEYYSHSFRSSQSSKQKISLIQDPTSVSQSGRQYFLRHVRTFRKSLSIYRSCSAIQWLYSSSLCLRSVSFIGAMLCVSNQTSVNVN